MNSFVLQIECEPEFLMEEFGTNPDIEEKPPISLHDALEKIKPFLMAYEGIENQQEWEVIKLLRFLIFLWINCSNYNSFHLPIHLINVNSFLLIF